jgi:hypothetical protein
VTLPDFLEGAIDLHVHSAPDVDRRRYDDLELAREARRAGMGGILLKSHQFSTVERASLVARVVDGIQIWGGIVLNETVGGLNPSAVRVALQMGARQVWMPTRSARNHRVHHGAPGGLTILDNEGRLSPEVLEILAIISSQPCILGTGHLSPEEVCSLVPEAVRSGVRNILITHPEWSPTCYPVELQKELAATGHVTFERCYVSTTHRCGFVPFETIEQAIEQVGIDTTVLSTDLGQPDTPPPADGFRLYAERLHSSGFSVDQIRRMMQSNPLRLLQGRG